MSLSAALLRSRGRFTARAAVLAVIVTVLAVASIYPLRLYLDQLDRVRQLARRTAVLERSNRELEDAAARLHDPDYLERLARECLGMVRPGEVAFVVVPEEGHRELARC